MLFNIPLNIPLLMVVVFLSIVLGIAFRFARVPTTFREYAIGNTPFSTAYLVATVLATAYGGRTVMHSVTEVHKFGLCAILTGIITGCLSFWIISPLALRMAPFMHHLSMSETVGSIYGKYPRVMVVLSNLFASIVMITIQINVMTIAIGMCIDSVDPKIITIISMLILILYSTFGGVHAVLITDLVQLGTFLVILPLLSCCIFRYIGKPMPEIISFLQTQERFQFSKLFQVNHNLWSMLTLFLSRLVFNISPPNIQRIYMSSDHFQASKVFLHTGMGSLYIKLFMLLIGLFAFVSAPDLPATVVWGHILSNISPLFKGFVVISLLAVSMSTADSHINSSAIMISQEITDIVYKKKNPDRHQFLLAKITTPILGIFSLMLSFYCNDLMELIKLGFDCFIPIVTGPFILTILGFRSSSYSVLTGMATGILAIIIWNKWVEPVTDVNGAFPCMLINSLVMITTHYLWPQKKRNKGVFDQANALKLWVNARASCASMRKENT
ncbi:sodium:solute symporter family protein [Candidatus Cardinium hertigii]|uniref:Sodium:solute symporter family protein n=2 Tax=Candidatus Cardinium hertigii TaxID=247481 RepID=A0A3N2QCJ3_9BACT|nr:sodium:solute symporter family protein [Candidatus Cardinium hertigii]ROT47495.1 sodium:solute symporter family protein [Candidatus Cardinium hertigii]